MEVATSRQFYNTQHEHYTHHTRRSADFTHRSCAFAPDHTAQTTP